MDQLIINAALTGMVPTKADNASVPLSPREIIQDAKRCYDAGGTIIHVHARASDGTPTYKKEIFAEIIEGIRRECPQVLISGSTSGRVFREFAQRSEVLTLEPPLRPDLGSLTLGSLNFPTRASINEPEMIVQLAEAMNALGVLAEWECFDIGMIDFGRHLINKGILKQPVYCNLFLGSLGTISATPENLFAMVRALPEGAIWSATGVGRFQFFINSIAITMGGHVRVGLEDNLFFDAEKTQPASNAGLIERVAKVAEAIGRKVASPAETRRIMGVPILSENKIAPAFRKLVNS